jgi:hypothetical protein
MSLTSPQTIRRHIPEDSNLRPDCLCGLVVRVPGYRSRGLGSIRGAARFFRVVMGLERGPLSLVNTIEELLERKSSGSCLEIREYCRRDPSRWPRGTLYPQKLALTSSISGSRSVGIVRSRTQVTRLVLDFCNLRPKNVACSSPLLKLYWNCSLATGTFSSLPAFICGIYVFVQRTQNKYLSTNASWSIRL